MLRALGALLLVLISATPGDARPRKATNGLHPLCNITMPCILPDASTSRQARETRGRYVARQLGFGAPIEKHTVRARKAVRKAVRTVLPRPRPAFVAPVIAAVERVAGIVAPLAAKVAEIQTTCGSKVVSAIRHTRIAGTRRMSQHSSGSAVDLVGNPGCIYAALRGYAGGYSTDYGRMRHVHISWGGPEHGRRFAHGGGKRYARNRHARYATAR